ncbi:MAG: hypothetical protein HYY06_23165 [Deltaproteobacteria bacterium]|nr:hypothetical protein [Deltaproteobacteria bacterium]
MQLGAQMRNGRSRAEARPAASWLVVVLLASAGCSGGDGLASGPRYEVVPGTLTVTDDPLLAAVAWWPLEATSVDLEVTDATEVPGVGAEFAWRPSSSPPMQARLATGDGEVAIGLLVAFVDVDEDGTATLEYEREAWEVSGLVPVGEDVLVGIATDFVFGFASADLAGNGDAAKLLGWPLREGVHLMGIDRGLDTDRLLPPTERERVPIHLVGSGGVGDGLCCEPLSDPRACGRPGVLCPDFRNRSE